MPRESRRRLAPHLRLVDALLDRWAKWSAGELERIGWGKSMSLKLIEWHELGVESESYKSLKQVPDCPDGVLIVDRLVSHLEPPLHNAVCAQYFMYAPVEDKARTCEQSVASFRRNLDRALHSIQHSLHVLEIET